MIIFLIFIFLCPFCFWCYIYFYCLFFDFLGKMDGGHDPRDVRRSGAGSRQDRLVRQAGDHLRYLSPGLQADCRGGQGAHHAQHHPQQQSGDPGRRAGRLHAEQGALLGREIDMQ